MEEGLENNECMQMIICMAWMWMPLVSSDEKITALMYAVCSYMPFSVR